MVDVKVASREGPMSANTGDSIETESLSGIKRPNDDRIYDIV
jgi:hypothetical protein